MRIEDVMHQTETATNTAPMIAQRYIKQNINRHAPTRARTIQELGEIKKSWTDLEAQKKAHWSG